MIDLKYSLVIEATTDPSFFGFHSPDLAGFTGVGRGGPGIVLASVAYESGLINGAFFTTLVLTAVLTSQFAGAWLGMVVRRGWTLLREDTPDLHVAVAEPAMSGAVRPETL